MGLVLRLNLGLRLPQGFRRLHRFGPLGAVGQGLPGRFGAAATLAHMVERRRLSFSPSLSDSGKVEVETCIAMSRCHHRALLALVASIFRGRLGNLFGGGWSLRVVG